MKGAAVLLISYALTMVCSGALELGHDVLHYLADHHHSTLHSHDHDHHHGMRDHGHSHAHQHGSLSHSHETSSEEESRTCIVNFFLFTERSSEFSFHNTLFTRVTVRTGNSSESLYLLPTTPPPQNVSLVHT